MFCCGDAIRGEPAVDHFVPWARYPLDLGHNFVLPDARAMATRPPGWRLSSTSSVGARATRGPQWTADLEGRVLAHDIRRTGRVAAWAYGQADLVGATVWERGREGMVGLDPRWRGLLLA